MALKVSSLGVSNCFQGDVLKNALFQKLLSDIYIDLYTGDRRLGREIEGTFFSKTKKDRDLNDTAF